MTAANTLAAGAPAAMLPCPACGSSVRGANLRRHLDKHGATSDAWVWSGRDGRVRRPLFGLLTFAILVVAVVFALDPDAGPVVAEAPPVVVAALVVSVLALTVVAVVATGVLKARLVVEGDALVLRFALGLSRHRTPLRAPVEVGGLIRTVGGSGGDPSRTGTPSMDVPAGTYLAVGTGRRRLVVGCSSSTEVRAHWSGWQPGGKRRRVDIILAAGHFVSIQYALHERGLLTLRE